MKGYQDYQLFSGDFANLIESLRWTEDSVEEERLINNLAAMHTDNKEFADKFLLVADTQEITTLMEAGFGVTPAETFRYFYDNEGNYFNDKGS